MKSVKETFLLVLELELFTLKPKSSALCLRYMDNMLTSAYQSSVLSAENLNIMITSAPRKVNILIMCKLMTLIIQRLSRMSHISSEITSDVDELIKTSTPIPDEAHVRKENISDV